MEAECQLFSCFAKSILTFAIGDAEHVFMEKQSETLLNILHFISLIVRLEILKGWQTEKAKACS